MSCATDAVFGSEMVVEINSATSDASITVAEVTATDTDVVSGVVEPACDGIAHFGGVFDENELLSSDELPLAVDESDLDSLR